MKQLRAGLTSQIRKLVSLIVTLWQQYEIKLYRFEKLIKKRWQSFWEVERPLTIKFIAFSLLLLFSLLIYHVLLIYYAKFLKTYFPASDINIGVVGDSLAVLSFLALIYSLILTVNSLKKQSKALELSREEMELTREELAGTKIANIEANKQRARHEVLANIRTLSKSLETVNGEQQWSDESIKLIAGFNISQLMEGALEILVDLTREYKAESKLLADFAQNIIDSNKMKLSKTNYEEADLRKAQLKEAFLWGTNFRKANFLEANLEEAGLLAANLDMASMMGVNLKKAILARAILVEAFLKKANLAGADLSEAYLMGADLTDANLEGADFTDANIEGADFKGANLECAIFKGANLLYVKNITVEQLCKVKTLYEANLEAGVKEHVKRVCTGLFEKPS